MEMMEEYVLNLRPEEWRMPDEMPTRILGKTGERVSALGLGGADIGKPNLTSRVTKTSQRRRNTNSDSTPFRCL